MKAVILAGGQGTRITEETSVRPKPLIEIGGKPILWHIMKIYSVFNITEFIICCGYKGYLIKEYFTNYYLHTSDFTFDISSNKISFHNKRNENWNITLIDTGEFTETGGRLNRVKEYLKNDTSFCFTYGDGVADININNLISFHKMENKPVTLTAVRPPGRYGALSFNEDNQLTGFQEKTEGEKNWINGGFFVVDKSIFDFTEFKDSSVWEVDVLPMLAKNSQLSAYRHDKFWQPMDTLRDKNQLNNLWNNNKAPWKIWD